MARRIGQLFEAAFTEDALHAAFLDARRSKRSSRAVLRFEAALGAEIKALHAELHTGTYRPRPYNTFVIREPKERVIYAPAFRDTVVQHAIYRTVYDAFDRTFVATSFACRRGYGTHRASDYALAALRACAPESYTLQLDIRRFFYSIDHGVLRGLIERRIKDRRMTDVMALFVSYGEPRGIPIGNLLSQLYALVYLNPLDHFVKRELGAQYYARYVDDFILFGLSRPECLAHRETIRAFLADELRLEISRSTIQKVKRGVNLVGYRTWPTHRLIRKHSLYRFRRAARRGDLACIVSLLGHVRRTESLRHMLDYLRNHHAPLYRALPPSHRRLHHAPPHRA